MFYRYLAALVARSSKLCLITDVKLKDGRFEVCFYKINQAISLSKSVMCSLQNTFEKLSRPYEISNTLRWHQFSFVHRIHFISVK